jgi:hypothetical protein
MGKINLNSQRALTLLAETRFLINEVALEIQMKVIICFLLVLLTTSLHAVVEWQSYEFPSLLKLLLDESKDVFSLSSSASSPPLCLFDEFTVEFKTTQSLSRKKLLYSYLAVSYSLGDAFFISPLTNLMDTFQANNNGVRFKLHIT